MEIKFHFELSNENSEASKYYLYNIVKVLYVIKCNHRINLIFSIYIYI